jgi:hypothetical protein
MNEQQPLTETPDNQQPKIDSCGKNCFSRLFGDIFLKMNVKKVHLHQPTAKIDTTSHFDNGT